MIDDLNPDSVLDPFCGSGTIGEVCESLGIPWLGFELNPDYIHDAELRLHQGMEKYHPKSKQITIQEMIK
jgi:DNA modification methylase